MWTLPQVEEAFALFKEASPGVELEVWFCDRGLCVFKTPGPDALPASTQEKLSKLCWSWCDDPNEYGDKCWYLFRSD